MAELPVIAKAASRNRVHRSGAAGGTELTDSRSREEMRAFLQKRLAAFGLMLAAVFGMFFVWRVIGALTGDDSPSQAFLPWQGLAVAAFAATWVLCRGGARSLGFLRATEAAALLIAGGCVVMMCMQMSYAARPDTILLLCLTYMLVARSIMVPSTARRTLVFGLVLAVPFLASVYAIHNLHHDPSIYTAAADRRLHLEPPVIAARWTVVASLWWIAALTITTATSRVIYGLRKEVRDARRLGQYTLLEKLGEGGMGAVFRARHAMLRRPTAIKLLPPEKFGAESVARFEREVQLTASLTHPNTIRIFDYGRTPDGIFYYAMEYLEGANLADVVAVGGPLPAGRVIHVLEQVAGALAEAHHAGLIHRDVKPANIFLTEQGRMPDVAKVLDFGLVKKVRDADGTDSTALALSQDDRISGTPLYMAPEAITSPDKVDPRTDLYSLGAVGYYLLTAQDVFRGRNVLEVCSHHLQSEPVAPSRRLGAPVPDDLEALILRCLAKDPHERPADATALRSALRGCRDAQAWTDEDARRWFLAHGEALEARQSRSSVGSAATVAVDLGVRLDGEPGRRKVG